MAAQAHKSSTVLHRQGGFHDNQPTATAGEATAARIFFLLLFGLQKKKKVVVGPTLGNMEAVRSLFAPPASRGLETLNNCDIIKPNCESLLNRARLCDAIQPARLPFISV